ncbi:MAG: hypothetical protein ACRC33_00430, partial [Gemmataceae bacterium]
MTRRSFLIVLLAGWLCHGSASAGFVVDTTVTTGGTWSEVGGPRSGAVATQNHALFVVRSAADYVAAPF